MQEIIEEENIKIEDMIYEVRGKQVMLDSDLAKLYQCVNGTKTINQAVKRHIERFPDDFYFRLTEEEYYFCSRSQIGTLNKSGNNRGQNIKYLPYVFTEQGVAMLSTILRTSVAAKVSINIMRAFVSMRKYISSNLIEQKFINNLVIKHEQEISDIFKYFENKEPANEIYFNGQIYDAYSKIIDIMKEAKDELIIVDGYADKTVLDMISNIKCNTSLITKRNNLLKPIDIEKYNKQYSNLNIVYNDTFHYRYIILDSKTIYHCGTSINHAGNKTFSINKLEDQFVIDSLIRKIDEIV